MRWRFQVSQKAASPERHVLGMHVPSKGRCEGCSKVTLTLTLTLTLPLPQASWGLCAGRRDRRHAAAAGGGGECRTARGSGDGRRARRRGAPHTSQARTPKQLQQAVMPPVAPYLSMRCMAQGVGQPARHRGMPVYMRPRRSQLLHADSALDGVSIACRSGRPGKMHLLWGMLQAVVLSC